MTMSHKLREMSHADPAPSKRVARVAQLFKKNQQLLLSSKRICFVSIRSSQGCALLFVKKKFDKTRELLRKSSPAYLCFSFIWVPLPQKLGSLFEALKKHVRSFKACSGLPDSTFMDFIKIGVNAKNFYQ